MERFDLDEKAAFLVLTRVSSESEVKVSEIAREFVQTRHHDGIPDQRSSDSHPDGRAVRQASQTLAGSC